MAPKGVGLPAPITFLRDLFGGDFDTVDGEVNATVASAQLVGGDPEAVALTIVNLGTDTVFVRPKQAASASAGIPLVAGGGSISLIVRDDGPLATYDWYVVANSGVQDVYFIRLSRYTQIEA